MDASASHLEILDRLVAFDTTSHRSNLELVDYVRRYLDRHGVACELDHSPDRAKANLYATIGKGGVGGVLLSGHTDVVPVDGQDWSTEPFRMTRKGERLHGRGTTDMKGFLACVLAAVPDFAGRDLATPIHLAFSYDEEVGCTGVRSLIDDLARRADKPKMCIVGEPTGMKLVVAHKGRQSIRVTVTGSECHSALAPRGVNAIEYAASLIDFIRSLAEEKLKHGPHDHGFDVPASTLVTGLVRGGTSLNIVPAECVFDFEIRDMPPDHPHELRRRIEVFVEDVLLPKMHAVDPSTGIRLETLAARPSLDAAGGEQAVDFVSGLLASHPHEKVGFGTEAALFQVQGGIPSVVCGPGDIGRAHRPNEYIELAELEQCSQFLSRLADRLR